jgi:hypothetical protein
MRLLSAAIALLIAVCMLEPTAAAAPPSAAETRAEKSQEKKRLSDAQIKKLLIDESIAAYDGNCPCPYSRARNGSRCGRRSAYSREGGAEPLCYPGDVTADMVQSYRDEHAED